MDFDMNNAVLIDNQWHEGSGTDLISVNPLTDAFDVSKSAITVLTGAQILLTAVVGVALYE